MAWAYRWYSIPPGFPDCEGTYIRTDRKSVANRTDDSTRRRRIANASLFVENTARKHLLFCCLIHPSFICTRQHDLYHNIRNREDRQTEKTENSAYVYANSAALYAYTLTWHNFSSHFYYKGIMSFIWRDITWLWSYFQSKHQPNRTEILNYCNEIGLPISRLSTNK